MKKTAKMLATCFGLGYVPLAPGTATSLVVSAAYFLWLSRFSWPVTAAVALLLLLVGGVVSSICSRDWNEKDPRRIVIDEAAGQTAALLFVSRSWLLVLSAFLLFRIFDILKPFPIKKLERLPSGWGIMADDLGAAAYTALLVHAALFLKNIILP